MKISSVFATVTYKLILEFNHSEYRLLDIAQFLQNDKGKLKELMDINMFRTAKIDLKAGTVFWENGVDFDPEILYKSSISIDHIFVNEGRDKKT